jgi:non-ribosomal peptide synthetase component F
MSTFDIFASLKSGATLCIAPDQFLLFPKKLINLMQAEKVTIWKGISSLLMYLAKTGSLENKNLPSLKKIIFAGEVLPTKYLIEWMEQYPEIEFYNGYGPTEGTGMSLYYKVKKIPVDPKEMIPIGKACANSEVILLKENNEPTQISEIGEICLRGSNLASGYWNDTDKTEKAFIKNPSGFQKSDRIYRTGDLAVQREDGNYEFIGRKDQQVKWMGYRIELGDIESVLLSFDEIADAVVYLSDGYGSGDEKELIACVEVVGDTDLSQTMAALAEQLPPYMIPKKLVPIERIPRNERGKIDRNKLNAYCSEVL